MNYNDLQNDRDDKEYYQPHEIHVKKHVFLTRFVQVRTIPGVKHEDNDKPVNTEEGENDVRNIKKRTYDTYGIFYCQNEKRTISQNVKSGMYSVHEVINLP